MREEETTVIRIQNLSKRFDIQKTKASTSFFKKNKIKSFWALNKINLEITKGKCIGVIGSNGAGKSTLLKLIGSIYVPTEGRIELNGRVNSLLEVGTGFQKHLTGRQNIFLNSSIMGMSYSETLEAFEKILEFSEIGEFIDTPVKFYSSGMYARLAFSVAIHQTSEILLVDEVLSVGDMKFREKSMNSMTNLLSSDQKTVIFVSHSLNSITKLCDEVIWLHKGKVEMFGETDEVVEKYIEFSLPSQVNFQQKNMLSNIEKRNNPLTEATVEVKSFAIKNSDKVEKNIFSTSDQIFFEVNFKKRFKSSAIQCVVHVSCLPRKGVADLTHVFTSHSPSIYETGEQKIVVEMPTNLFIVGSYKIDFAFVTRAKPLIKHLRIENAGKFDVFEDKNSASMFDLSAIHGVIHPLLEWKTEPFRNDE